MEQPEAGATCSSSDDPTEDGVGEETNDEREEGAEAADEGEDGAGAGDGGAN